MATPTVLAVLSCDISELPPLDVLGHKDFIRLRIGIGRPERGDVTGHVLSRFSSNEQKLLPQLLDTAAEAVEKILSSGVTEAMNSFNNYNLLE